MYVRYKKNIQENDLPRKRVRKASKIAGSGGQYLEIRCPERGRKRWNFIIGEIIRVKKIINSERGGNSLFPTVTLIIISSFGRKTFYLISDANVESL